MFKTVLDHTAETDMIAIKQLKSRFFKKTKTNTLRDLSLLHITIAVYKAKVI